MQVKTKVTQVWWYTPALLTSWARLWEPLVYSYSISSFILSNLSLRRLPIEMLAHRILLRRLLLKFMFYKKTQKYQIIFKFIVYRKGDIVKQPMKKGSFVPKNVPGVGWGGVGGSCRGGTGHAGVGWVMLGWGRSCRGGVHYVGVGWIM